MKKFTVFLCGVVLVFGLTSNAGATMLTWTDDGTYEASYGGINTIVYTLTFDEEEDDDYFTGAVFTITTGANVGPSEWRVGWIAFKFSPAGGMVDNLDTSPDGWDEGTAITVVPWGALGAPGDIEPFKNSWAGLYANDLEPEGAAPGGEWLTEGPVTYEFVFDFHILDPGKVFAEEMPFKVGFYDEWVGEGAQAKIKTDQLSESLAVPEPATMLLLGAGLIGLAGLGRKEFLKRV